MRRLTRSKWTLAVGAVSAIFGLPGFVEDGRVWLEWLGPTSSRVSTLAAACGGTLIAMWLLSKALDVVEPRLWKHRVTRTLDVYQSLEGSDRVKRGILVSRLGKLGLGAPSPLASDEVWQHYLDLMRVHAHEGQQEAAQELGKLVRGTKE